MKTIKEWLQELPDGYREKALSQANSSILESKVSSLRTTLMTFTNWDKTNEGENFWGTICNWAKNPTKYQLPPLPQPNLPKELLPLQEKYNISIDTKEVITLTPKPTIDLDKIKTGSKVMLKRTGKHVEGIDNMDLSKPFDVVFFKTPYFIYPTDLEFRRFGGHEFYCTFHQNNYYVLFNAENNTDFITKVIEY